MFFAKDMNLILHIINMKKNFYITALHNGHLELRESSQVTCDNAIHHLFLIVEETRQDGSFFGYKDFFYMFVS